MEGKYYAKSCKLIIADRYWPLSYFFAADNSELPVWFVSYLSQVMGTKS